MKVIKILTDIPSSQQLIDLILREFPNNVHKIFSWDTDVDGDLSIFRSGCGKHFGRVNGTDLVCGVDGCFCPSCR